MAGAAALAWGKAAITNTVDRRQHEACNAVDCQANTDKICTLACHQLSWKFAPSRKVCAMFIWFVYKVGR
jgi:hypothetical protein